MVWIVEPATLATAGRVQRLLVASTVLGVRVASRRRKFSVRPLGLHKLPFPPSALQVARQMLPFSVAPAPFRRLAPVALGLAVLMTRAGGVRLPIVLLVGVAVLPVALAPLVPQPAGEVVGPCIASPVAPLAVVVLPRRAPVWSAAAGVVIIPPA